VRLELSSQEIDVLQETLEIALSELRMEIADTDKKEFRDMLKGKKMILMAIVDRLSRAERPAPQAAAERGEPG
jgi:hypothetical protein